MLTKRTQSARSYNHLKSLDAWNKRNKLFDYNSNSFIIFRFNTSPIKFIRTRNFVSKDEFSKYGKMKIDTNMLNGNFLSTNVANFMNMNHLPDIYDQPNLNKLRTIKTLVEKVDLSIALVKSRNNEFVLKSFPVIRTDILNKFELLGQLINTDTENADNDETRNMFRLFEQYIHAVDSIEDFYLDTGLFDNKKEKIREGIKMIKNSFTLIENSKEVIIGDFPSIEALETLYDFYNYICLNMIFRTYSEANAESIIGLFCNQLVLTKTAPGFCLTYGTFKTNSKENTQFIPSNMKPSLDEYTHGIPMQHIAIEKMEKTLFDLIDEGFFSLEFYDMETVCERYLDLILQVTMSLYSAQKKYGFVHNDLHARNIMIKYYDGPIVYCIDEKKINHADKIFPPDHFPRDEDGFIKFKLSTKLGFYNIIDFGMAIIKTPKYEINSRTVELIAKTHRVDNYNPYNFNNDILKMFVSMYDNDFHIKLLESFNSGNPSPEVITLTYIFEQVYTCHLADEDTMEWLFNVKEDKCGADDDCSLLFMFYGVYGYGDHPKCKNPNGAIPENLLKYFDIFCDPTIDMKKESLCYSIV